MKDSHKYFLITIIMNELYKKALSSYIEMLEIHIDTKTADIDFHEKTQDFYESFFEIAHKIGERTVDLGGKIRDDSLENKKKRAQEIIVNLKKDIENYQSSGNVSL
jgi:DNA-binding ferritin-like protein